MNMGLLHLNNIVDNIDKSCKYNLEQKMLIAFFFYKSVKFLPTTFYLWDFS